MSVDRAVLNELLTLVPGSERWLERTELNFLATILGADERIIAGDTALLIERGKLAMRTWVVVVTTERLVCLKGSSDGLRKVEMPVSRMTAAYSEARLGYHEVIVESGKEKLILSRLPTEAALDLANAISSQFAQANRTAPVTRAEFEALAIELDNAKKRLSAVEEIIKRAAARSGAAGTPV
jgi:hypothetical protein